MGHVRDRWMVPGPNGRKVRSARWGNGKRWQARWQDARGHEHARAFAAKEAAEQYLARVATGEVWEAPPVSFGDYAETWRREQLHHRASTVEATEGYFRRMLLTSAIAPMKLGAITRADVQAVVGEWSKSYYPSTVKIAYGYVAAVYKRALADRMVRFTPCVHISLPEQTKLLIQPLLVEQVETIAARVPAWYRSMVVVAAATGMRGGELRGLTVDRVLNGSVRIDRQLVGSSGRRPEFGPTKTPAGVRTVSLGEVAATELQADVADRPPNDLVWKTRTGAPIGRGDASEVWRAATSDMSLRPRSGWHDLRHFHASLLIGAGLSPRAVADRLGHEDPAETLRTYAHLWPSDQDRAVAATDLALVRLRSVESCQAELDERPEPVRARSLARRRAARRA